jgi:hypothetical protein
MGTTPFVPDGSQRRSYTRPMSSGLGDAASAGARVSIAGRAIDDAEALEEAERQVADGLRPMSDAEKHAAEAASDEAAVLANEHGPDYHGFGHPPSK